jgi:hypothetical protein
VKHIRIMTLGVVAGVLAVLGCRDDAKTPTGPEAAPEAASAVAAVSGSLAFRQVSAGRTHTCGLATDGRAYCWGSNNRGQLGNGTQTQRLRPVAVSTGTVRFVQISAGGSHTCAVTAENRPYCWGANFAGQLGDGTFTARLTPVRVGTRLFRQIRAGDEYTCGLNLNGAAYCWGNNEFGQLGKSGVFEGPNGQSGTPTPVLVGGGHTWQQVIPGVSHTCGATTNNLGYCWGANDHGQLGNNSQTGSAKPVAIAGGLHFRQVAPGFGDYVRGRDFPSTEGANTCGLTTDDLAYCWGDMSRTTQKLPVAVAEGRHYRFISVGIQSACAVTLSYAPFCWGFDLDPVRVPGGLFFNAVSLFALGGHRCGWTRDDNRAYCWGNNSNGQLGNGTTTSSSTPVAVLGPI